MITSRRTHARANHSPRPAPARRTGGPRGFTLMELLVVIGVIALVAAAAVPSIWNIFAAGADAQGFNLMGSQLTAARGEAVQVSGYVGVHVQFAAADAARTDVKNACFAALVQYTGGASGTFRGVAGYPPQRMPGTIGFGELPGRETGVDEYKFVDSAGDFQNVGGDVNTQSNLDDFTSFTVVFSPTGAAVRQTPVHDDNDSSRNGLVVFGAGDKLFAAGSTKLWDSGVANLNGGECPATAMALFDFAELLKSDDRIQYLNGNAQYLPVNVHTGLLFPRR